MLAWMTSPTSTSTTHTPGTEAEQAAVSLDRWLWAARFYKTRSLAKAAVEGGKVHLDGQRTKPAKEVRQGQQLTITRGNFEAVINILQVSERRGPAPVAQALYEETAESIEQRESQVARRRMERAGLVVPDTKPSKKERRDLRKLKSLDDSA